MTLQRQQAEPSSDLQTRLTGLMETIDWRLSAAVGAGAWVAGVVLTYLVLLIFSVADESMSAQAADWSNLDMASAILAETVGTTIGPETGDEIGSMTVAAYSGLDVNYFGAGIFVHYLIPMLVVVVAGYALASRYLSTGIAATPLEAVVGGGSLAVGFAPALILGTMIFEPSSTSVETLELLLFGLGYPLVFGVIGATFKAATPLTSAWGFLGGIGAFVLGLGLWLVLESPLDDEKWQPSGIDDDREEIASFTDLQGGVEHFDFFGDFVTTHGLESSTLLPDWYVMLAALLVGAGVAYQYKTVDPVAGTGYGARVGVGYVIPVTLVIVGAAVTQIQEIQDTVDGSWTDQVIQFVNLLIGQIPAGIILAGIFYPVVFAAIGGAIGAKVYESQRD